MASLEGRWLGRRHIIRRIGGGGMGDVYLAEEPHLNRQIAVKVIGGMETNAESVTPEATQARWQFAQEARAVAALDHPNILPLYDYGEQDGIHYLVMPYVKDGSLADLLTRDPQRRFVPPLAPPLAAHIIAQSADALQFAHDHGVLHRDVKPHNLLVRLAPGSASAPLTPGANALATPRLTVHILLADFGVARFQEELSSQTGATGTPLYSAPEQFAGRPVYATDQYALACVAYLLLTGQPIFRGSIAELYHQHLSVAPTPPSRVNPMLSTAVDAALLRALAKQPADRFPQVADFGQALASAAYALGDSAQPPTLPWGAVSAFDAGQTTPVHTSAQSTAERHASPAESGAPGISPVSLSPSMRPQANARQLPPDAAMQLPSLTEIDPQRDVIERYTVPDTAHRVDVDARYALPPATPTPATSGPQSPAHLVIGSRKVGSGRRRTLLLALASAVVLAALAGVGAANGGLAALRTLGATGSEHPGVGTATTIAAATVTATQGPTPTATALPNYYTPSGFTRTFARSFTIAYPSQWTSNAGAIPPTGFQYGSGPIQVANDTGNTPGFPMVFADESLVLGNDGDLEGAYTMDGGTMPTGPESVVSVNGVQWHERIVVTNANGAVTTDLYVVCIQTDVAYDNNAFAYLIHFTSLGNYANDYNAYFYPMWQSFAFGNVPGFPNTSS